MKLKENKYKQVVYDLIIWLKNNGMYLNEPDVYNILEITKRHIEDAYSYVLPLYKRNGQYSKSDIEIIFQKIASGYTCNYYIRKTKKEYPLGDIFI